MRSYVSCFGEPEQQAPDQAFALARVEAHEFDGALRLIEDQAGEI